MINRSLMQRQMFAKGGEALKPIPAGNRGLPNLPTEVRNRMGYMQEGGAVPNPPMPEAPVAPPMMPPMMPGEAMAQTLPEDPMRDTLAAVQQNLDTLDEADNAEDMINAIRGNELPLEARYAELAELVGPEDAKQTPESVLALVQPTILMSLDEGIGALAQEEMDVPVEGPMAGGIMSTMAPPADPGPPMPMPMGAPPANFNQGGLVRRGDNQPVQYFQDANEQREVRSIKDLYETEYLPQYKSLAGDTEGQLEQTRNFAKSQALFDLARTGLAFAGPMPGEPAGLSPAQRLAMAAQVTDLPGSLQKRGAVVREQEQKIADRDRALELAALEKAADERTTRLGFAQQTGERLGSQGFQINLLGKKQDFEQNMQNLRQQFARSERESGQEFTTRLTTLNDQLQKQRMALENSFVVGRDERLNAIKQEQMKLGKQLDSALIDQRHENTLEQLDLSEEYRSIRDFRLQGFEEKNIGLRGEVSENLSRLNNSLAITRDDLQRGFTAAEAAKDRLLKKGLQINEQNFRMELQNDQQNFAADQNDQDRQIKSAMDIFRRDFMNRQLDLAEREFDFKQIYDNKALAISALAADYKRDMDAINKNQISYISDQDRLDEFARGDLTSTEDNIMQNVLADYFAPGKTYYDGSKTINLPAPRMPDSVMQALRTRQANGLSMPPIRNFVLADKAPKRDVETTEFKQDVYKAFTQAPTGGEIDISLLTDNYNPTIIDPNGLYAAETGIGSAPGKIHSYLKENFGEIFDNTQLTPRQRKIIEAGKDYQSLFNTTNSRLVGLSFEGDRVLKSVQDEIRKSLKPLKGGTLNTDENVLAASKSISKQLKFYMQNLMERIPDYNPDATGEYNQTKIEKARKMLSPTRDLIIEYAALEKVLETAISQRGQSQQADPDITNRVRTQIRGLQTDQ